MEDNKNKNEHTEIVSSFNTKFEENSNEWMRNYGKVMEQIFGSERKHRTKKDKNYESSASKNKNQSI